MDNIIICVMLFSSIATCLGGDVDFCDIKKSKPNVILIAIDTLRADHLKCYGYCNSTSPNIDAFAKEGTLFERCYSTSAWTLPAFMSIFTGVMPSVHKMKGIDTVIPLSDSIPTLAEKFTEEGYFCGAVVSNSYLSGRYGFYRGFDIYDDYSVFLETFSNGFGVNKIANYNTTADVKSGRHVLENSKKLLDKAKKSGKPFFLFVHFYDPHDRYIPPYPLCEKFEVDFSGPRLGFDVGKFRNSVPEHSDLQNLVKLYDGEIAYNDIHFGEFIREIDSGGCKENTIVIFTSDHGEAFGEHGALLHGNNTHTEETNVPMIWRWPGVISTGHRVKTPVSILDIPKTIGELLNFKKSELYQGTSLWDGLLNNQLAEGRIVISEQEEYIAITKGRYRWHSNNGNALLFDVLNDPLEQINTIDIAEKEVISDFEDSCKRFIDNCSTLSVHFDSIQEEKAETIELSDDQIQRLKSLGYVQ